MASAPQPVKKLISNLPWEFQQRNRSSSHQPQHVLACELPCFLRPRSHLGKQCVYYRALSPPLTLATGHHPNPPGFSLHCCLLVLATPFHFPQLTARDTRLPPVLSTNTLFPPCTCPPHLTASAPLLSPRPPNTTPGYPAPLL